MKISDNTLAAFYAQNSSSEENEMILHEIINDDFFEEVIDVLDEVNSLDLDDAEKSFYESETLVIKPNFRKTMSDKKSNFAVAGAASVAAHRLVGMVRQGRFSHIVHGNVASNMFGGDEKQPSHLQSGETAGSVGSGETAGSVGTRYIHNNLMDGETAGSVGFHDVSRNGWYGETAGSVGAGETAGSVGTLIDDTLLRQGETAGSVGFAHAETVHGLPEMNVKFDPNVYQYYDDTCAIQSQALILREYGFDVTQEELIQIAREHGWYVDGIGTPADKIGKLLEHHGVDTSITEGNNIFNLTNELAQGHRVVVGVDCGELWAPGVSEKLEDLICQRADHALLVVGVDTTDPKNVKVIVSDPGNGNAQYAYSESQFMDAWKDSNCVMAATTESPEEFINDIELPPMESFADLSYDSISRLADSHILMDDGSCYHEFFDDLMEDPTHLDQLLDKYSDLFIEDEEEFWEDDLE